ncbi:hypothetical protein [Mangrovimonas futianensis]|uniref:hypothetical protein n=1 Tax=Mangrovimonas futianensis TaxID=2895523 RepID=UPI001E30AEF4|nr:hypothetical protein [Mangrovimonas futianensis]MCF1422220.1 hypothetical protein [Mangrovimonas futianensis]
MRLNKGSFGMLFGQRKNKQFNYKSRFNTDKESASEDKPKFEFHWAEESKLRQQKASKIFSLPILVLFLAMILILWFVLSRYE